ncbi:MAG: hypothetical protein AABO58_23100 [Acidobacteriota bacterium]
MLLEIRALFSVFCGRSGDLLAHLVEGGIEHGDQRDDELLTLGALRAVLHLQNGIAQQLQVGSQALAVILTRPRGRSR